MIVDFVDTTHAVLIYILGTSYDEIVANNNNNYYYVDLTSVMTFSVSLSAYM